MPNAYFVAFISYSLILLFEKVAFDSHSLTQHEHGEHHNDLKEPLLPKDEKENEHHDHHETPILDNEYADISANKQSNLRESYKAHHVIESRNQSHRSSIKMANKHPFVQKASMDEFLNLKCREQNKNNSACSDSDSGSDADEETLKNVVSSKGKFASYMQARNICK